MLDKKGKGHSLKNYITNKKKTTTKKSPKKDKKLKKKPSNKQTNKTKTEIMKSFIQ